MRQFCGCVVALLCGISTGFSEDRTVQSPPPRDSMSPVRELIETGLSPGLANFRKAERIWRTANLAAKRDARIDFAWGLVLRKHSKNRDAERQFLIAAGRTPQRYLPARQAAVWMKLARGQTSTGLAQVNLLIRAVTNKSTIKSDEAVEVAKWIGTVVAALDETELSKRDHTRCVASSRV